MRRLAAAVLVAAAAVPAAEASAGVRAAAEWAAGRAGDVSFALRTRDGLAGRGVDRQYRSASVIKAMMMVTYLRRARERALTRYDRSLLEPMIRRSDNSAATTIRNIVGNAAIARLARRAGMSRFVVNPVWGYSLITARDQTRFFLRIDRLVPRAHRAYAMRLLRRIVPAQRWGFAEAAPDGWRLYFKGGWGSGSGAVDHQVGLLRRGRQRVAVAVLTVGNPTHEYGKATLEGVFRRLTKLRGTAGPAQPSLSTPR